MMLLLSNAGSLQQDSACLCGDLVYGLTVEAGPLVSVDVTSPDELNLFRTYELRLALRKLAPDDIGWVLLPRFRPHGLHCPLWFLSGRAIAFTIRPTLKAVVPIYVIAPDLPTLQMMMPPGAVQLDEPLLRLAGDIDAEFWK